MRILSLPIGDDDLLEVHNSMWTGEEKVFFNGQLVSRGSSVFGRTHYFTVQHNDREDDRYRVEVSMMWFGSITVDVFRNEHCLLGSARTPLSRVDGPARLKPAAPASAQKLKAAPEEFTSEEDYIV